MPRAGSLVFWLAVFIPLMAYHGIMLARLAQTNAFWAILLAGIPALTVFYSRRIGIAALGASLFISPIFGPTFTNVSILWFNFVVIAGLGLWQEKLKTRELLIWIAGLSISGAFLCGAAVSVFYHFDYFILSSILKGSGSIALLKYVINQPPAWERPVGEFLGYLNAFVLLVASRPLLAKKANRSAFEIGVAVGAALSLIYLFGQVLDLHFYFGLTRSAFFRYAGRYSASFSDPNSFGLMAYLTVAYLVSRTGQKYWKAFAGLSALMALGVLWSGSRTYWLGLFICFVLCLWLVLPGKRQRIFCLSLMSLCLFVVMLGWPRLNSAVSERLSLPSTARLLESINWDNAGKAADSRMIFGKLAIAAWSSSPIVGLGIDRFIWTQDQVASQLGVDLKDFRDNANNYYLQILTECGAAGLVLVLVGLISFGSMLGLPKRSSVFDVFRKNSSFKKIEEIVPRVLLWSLPVVLLTGPHLAFAEVRYFCVLLLAIYLVPKKIKHARPLIGVAVFCCLLSLGLILSTHRSQDRGLYGLEDGGVRWTAQKASFQMCPEKDSSLKLRALRPGIGYNPLHAKAVFERQDTGEMLQSSIEVQTNEWYSIEIPSELISDNISELRTELELDSIWSPFTDEWSSDMRGLGVQIDWDSVACEKEPEVIVAPWAKRLLSVSPISAKDATEN